MIPYVIENFESKLIFARFSLNYEKNNRESVNFTIIFSGLILADMERMMTPAAVLLEAVSAQDFFVARTRTNPEPETGTLLMTKDPETKRNRIGSRLWTQRIVQEVL